MSLFDEMNEEFTLFPIRRDQQSKKVKGNVVMGSGLLREGMLDFYFRDPYIVRAGDVLRRVSGEKEYLVRSEARESGLGIKICSVDEC